MTQSLVQTYRSAISLSSAWGKKFCPSVRMCLIRSSSAWKATAWTSVLQDSLIIPPNIFCFVTAKVETPDLCSWFKSLSALVTWGGEIFVALVSPLLVVRVKGHVDAQVPAPLTPLQPGQPCAVPRPSHHRHITQQLWPIPVLRLLLCHAPTFNAEMHSERCLLCSATSANGSVPPMVHSLFPSLLKQEFIRGW